MSTEQDLANLRNIREWHLREISRLSDQAAKRGGFTGTQRRYVDLLSSECDELYAQIAMCEESVKRRKEFHNLFKVAL